MSILLTGAAGFIGYHVSRALLARGETVIGVDNLNDYYDVTLKEARLAQASASSAPALRTARPSKRCAPNIPRSTASSTWQPRPAYAIR
jgi:UDP-glucuronate 4-epimerase